MISFKYFYIILSFFFRFCFIFIFYAYYSVFTFISKFNVQCTSTGEVAHKKQQLIIIIIITLTEPPLDQHMPFFTGKCFPSTSKKCSCRYQVPAETEHFVWLARDHTLYPGSWSKWKLLLNKITSGDVQQAKQWMWKLSLPLATKLNLIIVCKGWVSTQSIVFPTSAPKNMHVVTQKLDLDQMSVVPVHAEKHW